MLSAFALSLAGSFSRAAAARAILARRALSLGSCIVDLLVGESERLHGRPDIGVGFCINIGDRAIEQFCAQRGELGVRKVRKCALQFFGGLPVQVGKDLCLLALVVLTVLLIAQRGSLLRAIVREHRGDTVPANRRCDQVRQVGLVGAGRQIAVLNGKREQLVQLAAILAKHRAIAHDHHLPVRTELGLLAARLVLVVEQPMLGQEGQQRVALVGRAAQVLAAGGLGRRFAGGLFVGCSLLLRRGRAARIRCRRQGLQN